MIDVVAGEAIVHPVEQHDHGAAAAVAAVPVAISLGEALAQHRDGRDRSLVLEQHLTVRHERATAGARKIQRIEIEEPLVPGHLERRPHRPFVEPAIPIGVPRELPECLEQLAVGRRWLDAELEAAEGGQLAERRVDLAEVAARLLEVVEVPRALLERLAQQRVRRGDDELLVELRRQTEYPASGG